MSARLPTTREPGRLVLLIADVEGSTPLVAALGTTHYEQVLDVVRGALRRSVNEAGGDVVSFEGDGMVAVLPTVGAAIGAAVAAHRSLAASPPPFAVRPRLRCGVHVGEASRRADGDVIGLGVHEAARVASAAQGGQVVLSEAARAEVDAGGDVELLDAGPHHLRDFASPQRLHVARHVDLPGAVGPLRAPAAAVIGLPAPRTPLIGRDADVDGVVKQFATSRLVTVVGAGGVGKTRLAVEAARQLTSSFDDGAWFIDVTAATTAAELDAEVARRFQIPAGGDGRAAVLSRLADARALLVLDNCEHLVDAVAAFVDAVLDGATNAAILATSRERLAVRGEVVWRLAPLPVGGDGAAGVELLTQRVASLHGGATPVEPGVLAEAAALVDGLPLALELVAARLADGPASEVLSDLRTALAGLEGGYRTDATRHRGLRAMLASTYDRLGDEERVAFRRTGLLLSTVSADLAAEIVGGGDAERGAALLDRLQERSLVETVGDDGLRVLEPIREVALELLEHAGEDTEARAVHAAAVGRLVRDAVGSYGSGSESGSARPWRGVDDGLVANTRAALTWALQHEPDGVARLATDAVAMAARVGLAGEAMLWAERALAVAPPGVTRWRLLNNLAQLAATHGDPATANRCWNELESEVADADSEGDEFHGLLLSGKATAAMSSGDLVAARAFFEEANPYLERAELWTQLATARMAMGGLLAALGHADSAIATLEAGIEVATAHDDDHSLAMLRLQLGVVAGMHGDHQRVADESARAVESFTALGDANMLGMALLNLGAARSNLKDPAAGEALDDAVAVARRIGDRRLLVLALDARGNLRTGLDDDPRGDAPRDLAGGLADLDEAATTAQLAGLRSEAAKALAGGAAARCAHVPSRDVAATTGEAVRLAAGDPASLASVLGRAASAWAPSEPTRAAALAAAHCRLAAQLGLEPQAHIVNMAAAVDDLDLDVEVLAALAGGDTTAILS